MFLYYKAPHCASRKTPSDIHARTALKGIFGTCTNNPLQSRTVPSLPVGPTSRSRQQMLLPVDGAFQRAELPAFVSTRRSHETVQKESSSGDIPLGVQKHWVSHNAFTGSVRPQLPYHATPATLRRKTSPPEKVAMKRAKYRDAPRTPVCKLSNRLEADTELAKSHAHLKNADHLTSSHALNQSPPLKMKRKKNVNKKGRREENGRSARMLNYAKSHSVKKVHDESKLSQNTEYWEGWIDFKVPLWKQRDAWDDAKLTWSSQ